MLLQHYINSSVAGEATVLSSKEAQSLVTLIGTLSAKLDPSQRVSGYVFILMLLCAAAMKQHRL